MDIKEFEALYRKKRPALLGYCIKKCRNKDEAQDLCESAFLVLLKKVRIFESIDKTYLWLTNVVNKLCSNMYRKDKNYKALLHKIEEEGCKNEYE